MNLIFATNNQNKVLEVKNKLVNIEITTLNEIGIIEDIPETGDTLIENALQKARYVYHKTGENCFADDTGLEIEILNKEPGVYSARYAGEDKNSENNMNLVLEKLKNKENRNAYFKTVIALIIDGKELLFEGKVEGVITTSKSGKDGFGYDPIFKPFGYDITFAEMDISEKNKISHRALAVNKLVDFLSNN